MKAILLEKYGSTENLIFAEYPKPEIKDDTVLIKMLYTSLNSAVWADLSNPLSYGTFAEYVSVPASSLQRIPSDINLEEAACLPTAGMVALQNVNIKRKPKKGDKVLVNGAGGGIGTVLVQLLKSIGAEITAVDKLEKHQMLKSIGANTTIDYREMTIQKKI